MLLKVKNNTEKILYIDSLNTTVRPYKGKENFVLVDRDNIISNVEFITCVLRGDISVYNLDNTKWEEVKEEPEEKPKEETKKAVEQSNKTKSKSNRGRKKKTKSIPVKKATSVKKEKSVVISEGKIPLTVEAKENSEIPDFAKGFVNEGPYEDELYEG